MLVMHRIRLFRSLVIVATLAAVWMPGAALAASTAFTYQAELSNSGTADTSYDFEVVLFADPSGVTQVAGPFDFNNVVLDNGRFLLTIDAGSTVFTGPDRWLELRVRRGSETGAYTQLLPRQQLFATPYAQHAEDANFAASIPDGSVTTAKLASGAVTAAKADSSQIQLRIGTACAAGTAMTAVNANGSPVCAALPTGDITDVIASTGLSGGATSGSATLSVNPAVVQTRVGNTCATGSAIRVVNQDGTVSCETIPAASDWSRTGNAGTNPATNFLGTTDAQAFVIRTNNTRSLRIEPSTVLFNGAPITANVIAGSSANSVTAGVRGATIAGGGVPAGNSDPDLNQEQPNVVTDHYGTVGGGYGNTAGNGNGTLTDSLFATIGGGAINTASANYTTVGGGYQNNASGSVGTIGGGYNNIASANFTAVGGGDANHATGLDSTIGGGHGNTAGAQYSTIAGGFDNFAVASSNPTGYSTVGGGAFNSANAEFSTIAGGNSNIADGSTSSIGGGYGNTSAGAYGAVGGGQGNAASVSYGTVGGGNSNTASGSGIGNEASTVAGGKLNTASGDYSAVGGGYINTASGAGSAISGGNYNTATGAYAAIAGGTNNIASGVYSAVGGGFNNNAIGYTSAAGGTGNCAGGDYSFAGGYHAKVRPHADPDPGSPSNPCSGLASYSGNVAGDYGTFLWADNSTNADFITGGPNQFAARATGGVYFVSAVSPFVTGVALPPGAGAWSSLSDRNGKTDIETIDAQDVLARVLALPVYTWRYKTQESGIHHMGPMAQDFHAAFGLNGDDDKSISTVDPDGVALAAIQGLHAHFDARVEKLEVENAASEQRAARLEAENAALHAELAAIAQRLRALESTDSPR